MNTSDAGIVENVQADMVVVGGGGSGLSAALAAAEKGANVIVLESRPNTGGNSALAAGLFTVGRPGQKQAELETLVDEYFLSAMSYAHWKTDPRLVRALIEKSADVVPWLEKLGVKFKCENTIYKIVI